MLKQGIHIVGLGWLGLPLAKAAQNRGLTVSGTVSSIGKQQCLQNYVNTDVFQLYDGKGLDAARCKDAYLVLNIPPGRKNVNYSRYALAMIQLIDDAFTKGLHHICFVSTTSVYGQQTGVITNQSSVSAHSDSAVAHVKIENHLRQHYAKQHAIVRPAGLIGPSEVYLSKGINAIRYKTSTSQYRHPVFSLCHKQEIANGNDAVNLVHLDDLIAVISSIIENCLTGAFNVSALEHPSRAEYYTWCAKKLNLPIPGFLHDTLPDTLPENKKRQDGKIIDASNTFKQLGISPIHNSPFTMLPKGTTSPSQ